MSQAPRFRLPLARMWPWLSLILVMLLVVAIRVRLLQVPLERDEGEYAYMGQLMLQGVVPYKLAYTMKLPGTAATYTVIMGVLGQTTAAIHLGRLLVNLATILLIFMLARKLFDPVAGVGAAACYGLLSASPLSLVWQAMPLISLSSLPCLGPGCCSSRRSKARTQKEVCGTPNAQC